jgi:hypothetical protein
MKIGVVCYVRDIYKCAKFHHPTYKGSAPTNTWNITLLSFFYFLFIFIIFSGSRTARTAEAIFTVDGLKRVFWRYKEVPFGGLVDDWIKLGAWQPKNAQF